MLAKIIRAGFQTVSHIVPSLAGWGAFQLFIRPMSKPKKLHADMQARIDATLAEADSGLMGTSAGPVMLHCWRASVAAGKPAPKVLLLHGWTSRSDYMLNYVPLLLERGITCYAMDFPAHGRSPGKTLQYAQAVAAIQEVQWQIGPLLAQIGHSFGGAMSMMATRAADGGPFEAAPPHLVLVAAPSSLAGPAAYLARRLRLSDAAHENFRQRLVAKDKRDIEELSCRALPGHWSGRLTVVHDREDSEVVYQNALDVKAAYPAAELITTEGLGHRRILRTPEVSRQIVERIAADDRIAKCA